MNLLVFIHLTNQTKFLVRVCSFTKQTNVKGLPAEWSTNCSLNVWFICSPMHTILYVVIHYWQATKAPHLHP
ncbi:hypothetical protein Hanom_Chr17g01547031 [Helianthus anomalus]